MFRVRSATRSAKLPFQRVVLPLAGTAGDVGSISESRKLSRSFVTPLEHPDKQIEGGTGWRASLASAGIRGASDGGGILGKLATQPVSSSISPTDSGNRIFTLLSGGIDHLLFLSLAAGFLSARIGLGLLCGLGVLRASGCKFCNNCCCRCLGMGHANLLAGNHQHQRSAGYGEPGADVEQRDHLKPPVVLWLQAGALP